MNRKELVLALLVAFFLCFGLQTASTQLLNNGSFEVKHGSYPEGLKDVSDPPIVNDQVERCLSAGQARKWFIPSNSSSDVFNIKVSGSSPPTSPATDALAVGGTRFEDQTPAHEDGYIGLAVQSRVVGLVSQTYQYREYIAQELCTALTVGTTYRVRYLVAGAKDRYSVNRLALHSLRNVDLAFLTGNPHWDKKFIDYSHAAEPVAGTPTQTAVARYAGAGGAIVAPQVRSYDHGIASISSLSATIEQGYDDDEWLEVKHDFVADKPYTYVLIGNFDADFTDPNTFKKNPDVDQDVDDVRAYYLIDDVSVQKLSDASCCAIDQSQIVVDRVRLEEHTTVGCCFNVTVTHSKCDACPIKSVRIRYKATDGKEISTPATNFEKLLSPGQTQTLTICITDAFNEQDVTFEFLNKNDVQTCSATQKIGCVQCGCKELNDSKGRYVEFAWVMRPNDQVGSMAEGCRYDLEVTNKRCREPLSLLEFTVHRTGAAQHESNDAAFNHAAVQPNDYDNYDVFTAKDPKQPLSIRFGCPFRIATYFSLYGVPFSTDKAKLDVRDIKIDNCTIPGPFANQESCSRCEPTTQECYFSDSKRKLNVQQSSGDEFEDQTPGFPPYNTDARNPNNPFLEVSDDNNCCCCKYYNVDLVPISNTEPRDYRVVVGHDTEILSTLQGNLIDVNTSWGDIPEKCRVYSIGLYYTAYGEVNQGMHLLHREMKLAKNVQRCGEKTTQRMPLPSDDFSVGTMQDPNDLHNHMKRINGNLATGDYLKGSDVVYAWMEFFDNSGKRDRHVHNEYDVVNYQEAVAPWTTTTGELVVRPLEVCKQPNVDFSEVRIALYGRDGVLPICDYRGSINLQNIGPANPCKSLKPLVLAPTNVSDEQGEATQTGLQDPTIQLLDGVVIVKPSTQHNQTTVRIASLDGRVVRSDVKNAYEIRIPVSDLASGTYVVTVSSDVSVWSKKIVLIR
jgi:hypothetical protein